MACRQSGWVPGEMSSEELRRLEWKKRLLEGREGHRLRHYILNNHELTYVNIWGKSAVSNLRKSLSLMSYGVKLYAGIDRSRSITHKIYIYVTYHIHISLGISIRHTKSFWVHLR